MNHSRAWVLAATALLAIAGARAWAQDSSGNPQADKMAMDSMSSMHMDEHMSSHMRLTAVHAAQPGDAARAQAIVATLRGVLPAYRDYHAAVDAHFEPFLVTVQQLEGRNPPRGPAAQDGIIHFTNYSYAAEAALHFNAQHPTSLLYRWLGKDHLELVGAMYTAPWRMPEAGLDNRVPLSVARWHQHVNLCLPPAGQRLTADWTRFGPEGSIATEAACDAAGGAFYPRLFGWMVHVYPNETPDKIWGGQ